MKKVLLGLLTMLVFYSCDSKKTSVHPEPGTSTPTDKPTVTVMTYNIYGARSGGIPDLQAIADVINRAKPDLVALQEVDLNSNRNSKHGDIAKKLGELTNMDFFFAKAIDIAGGAYGDAVLSRLPIKDKKAFNLEVDPTLGGERRSVARILVEKDQKQFYFVSTHFDHLGDERNRIKQAHDFVSMVKEWDKPVLVGSDFNALPSSNPMNILRTHFSYGCLNGNCTQYTFPTENPNRTIDYIIYSPLNAFTTNLYSVYTWANKESDHFPVLATFTLN